MIKAIFFDIDGTLRDFEEKGIPEYTRRALDMAREAGLRLCIATGRHWLEIEEEGLLGDLEFDAYVTLNGQLCYVREGRELPGRAIYKNPIDPGQVRRLLEMMEEEPFPCLFMEEGRMYINYTDPRVELVRWGTSGGRWRIRYIRLCLMWMRSGPERLSRAFRAAAMPCGMREMRWICCHLGEENAGGLRGRWSISG